MDSTKFKLSKQAASPLDETDIRIKSIKIKPPHNIVQYGIGQHAAIRYNPTFNQITSGLKVQNVETPNATCTGALQRITKECVVLNRLDDEEKMLWGLKK